MQEKRGAVTGRHRMQEKNKRRDIEREIQVGGALTRLVPAKARHTSSLKTEDRVAPERRLGGLPL